MKWLILSVLPPSVFMTAQRVIMAAAEDAAPTKVFEPTAWFGLAGPILAAIGIIGAAWGLRQAGSVKAWKETAEAAVARADVHERESDRHMAIADEREKARVIAEGRIVEVMEALKLEQEKRDLSPILAQIIEMHKESVARNESTVAELQAHSARVTQRHEAMQETLEQIVRQLIKLTTQLSKDPGRSS